MKIVRNGSSRDHGRAIVEINKPLITWESTALSVMAKKPGVTGFDCRSKHDYKIYIGLTEIAKIIDAVSGAAVEHPKEISDSLAKCLRSLVRLTTVCAGGELRKPDPKP